MSVKISEAFSRFYVFRGNSRWGWYHQRGQEVQRDGQIHSWFWAFLLFSPHILPQKLTNVNLAAIPRPAGFTGTPSRALDAIITASLAPTVTGWGREITWFSVPTLIIHNNLKTEDLSQAPNFGFTQGLASRGSEAWINKQSQSFTFCCGSAERVGIAQKPCWQVLFPPVTQRGLCLVWCKTLRASLKAGTWNISREDSWQVLSWPSCVVLAWCIFSQPG